MPTDPGVVVQTVTNLLSVWGLRVIGALVLYIVGRMVAGVVRRQADRSLSASNTDPTLIPFLSGLVYYGVMTAVVIAVLALFGVQTTSLIAVLGAATLAVGLALQGTLANFAAGVMLLMFRPFGKGDFVDAAGVAGAVHEIGIFSTSLDTGDNVRIVVPNASIYGTAIKNFSVNDQRRIDLVIGVGYDDDLATAVETITRVLQADARVLRDREAVVAVGELGESSVDLLVRPWCQASDYWALRWDLLKRCKTELEAAGCSIPFPQRDVHMVSPTTATAA